MRTDGRESRILITGGSGFVGAHISRSFAVHGHAVTVLSKSQPSPSVLSLWDGLDIRVEIGDVRDKDRLESIARESAAQIIVHGAAITTEPAPSAGEILSLVDTNLCGSICALLAGVACGAARVVLVGSASVYEPPTLDSAVLGEDSPLRRSGWYALSKIFAERAGRQFALSGLEVVVARVAAAYGPLEHPTRIRSSTSIIHRAVEALRSGQQILLENPESTLDFTYVSDIADAVRHLSLAPHLQHYHYNISCGEASKLSDVLTSATRYAQARSFRRTKNAVLLDLGPDSRRGCLSIARLIDETDYRPQYSLDHGIMEYCEWLDETKDY